MQLEVVVEKFFEWLHIEPKGRALWLFAGLTVLGFLLYTFLFAAFFLKGHKPWPLSLERLLHGNSIYYLFVLPIRHYGLEEVWWRLLPLGMVLFREKDPSKVALFVAALLSSAWFGYQHGGWINIGIQGVLGFFLCMVFLKCGGLQGKYLKALFSSTLVHTGYNFSFAAIAIPFL